ncbi:MAG: hypothetical protein ACK4SO_08305, partial [Candidatus Kapaibacteriota bacterium]
MYISASNVIYAELQNFTFVDAMKFPRIMHQTISDDGLWVGYSLIPERGDAVSYIVSTEDTTKFRFERTTTPKFSPNSQWVILKLLPKAIEKENAEKEPPPEGYLLFNLKSQTKHTFENTKSFTFSNDSRWLAIHFKESQGIAKDSAAKKIGST